MMLRTAVIVFAAVLLTGINAHTAFSELQTKVAGTVQLFAAKPPSWTSAQSSLATASQQCSYFDSQNKEVSNANSALENLRFYTKIMRSVLGGSFQLVDIATEAVIKVLTAVEAMLTGIVAVLQPSCILAKFDSVTSLSDIREPLMSMHLLLVSVNATGSASAMETVAAKVDVELVAILKSLNSSSSSLLSTVVTKLTDKTGVVKSKMQAQPAASALLFLKKLNEMIDFSVLSISIRSLMSQGRDKFEALLQANKLKLNQLPSRMFPTFDASIPFLPVPKFDFVGLVEEFVDPATLLGSPGDVGKRLWALYAELASELPRVLSGLEGSQKALASGVLTLNYPYKTKVPPSESARVQGYVTLDLGTEIEVFCNTRQECSEVNNTNTEQTVPGSEERCSLPNGKFVGVGFRAEFSCNCEFTLTNGEVTTSYEATCQRVNGKVDFNEPVPQCMKNPSVCPAAGANGDVGDGCGALDATRAVAGVSLAVLLWNSMQ